MELLAVALLMLVVGLMFPYRMPLFGSFVAILFVYATLNKRLIIPKWTWLPFGGVVLFILWGLYNSQVNHPLLSRELKNVITVSVFALLLYSLLENKHKFDQFRSTTIRLLVLFTTLVSTIGLIKFMASLKGVEFEYFLVTDGLYPWGSALVNDTNYYALGGVIGLTAYIYAVFEEDRFVIKSKLHFIAGLIMAANISLAGSRRGIALLALVIIVAGTIWFTQKMKTAIGGSKKNALILLGALALLLSTVTVLKVRHTLWLIKPAVEMVGLDYGQFKQEATIITYRYMTILDDEMVFEDYYRRLWNEESTVDMSKIRSLNSRGVESRRVRWKVAMDMYKGHSAKQKLLGSGFDYLQVYEAKFSYLHHSPDYPHNPFLSALLFSGIAGLVVFSLFILQVVFLHVKYLRQESFFAAIFILVFAFNLISGNTFFSVKLVSVLCLVPFSYRKVFRESE